MKFILSCLVLAFLVQFFVACSEPEKSAGIEPQSLGVANREAVIEPSHASKMEATARTAEQMVAAGFKRYGIEKGALIFRYDGAVEGTDHIFFDHWGWREAKYTRTTTELGTFQETVNETQYIDGERRYVYDPKTNKATYFFSQQVTQMAAQYKTKDMVAVGDEMLKIMGGKPSGKAKVGNIECDVWIIEKNKIKLYMWQGLTMAEESYVNNIPIGRRCIQAELEKDLPLDRLLLPEGAVVENINK